MSFPVRAGFSFLAVFFLALCGASNGQTQTGLNDVHVVSRDPAVMLAKADYGSTSAGTGGLLHASVDLVLVPVTITDELHRPVIGLDRDNFQVFENKKRQPIQNFSSEDAPVSVGIILDASGSMGDKIDHAREAVTRFCDSANPQDEFFLITFSDTPRLLTDFTNSPGTVESDLLSVRPHGRTALLDALYFGLQKLRHARYGRKALLILSDGGDNHSRYNEHQVKAAIKESDVMIYGVGTYDRYFSTVEESLGPELLQDIAQMTGGYAFAIDNPNDLPEMTQKIGAQLRHQYLLVYRPQSGVHDGKWRKINVRLSVSKRVPFLHVQSRTGYYSGGQ